MTPEDKPPKLTGVQYATGQEWRNSSRKIEEAGPKWKQRSVVEESVVKVISDVVRTILHRNLES